MEVIGSKPTLVWSKTLFGQYCIIYSTVYQILYIKNTHFFLQIVFSGDK